ncbi:PTR2-domain-containing protein [Xylariaceae sp. FL0016]|nr:PTR2-domain-containing protein [Xylariaceae sp. FL0016]
MALNHEDGAAELNRYISERTERKKSVDITGAPLPQPTKSLDLGDTVTPVPENGPQDKPSQAITADDDEPNEHEKQTLRRIGDSLPWSAFTIAIVELCERFTYYGASGLFQNYISNATDGADGADGLGMGHQAATGLNVFFQFGCYVTPILGAVIADQYLGKYKTIVVFCFVYWIGLIILWTTAVPSAVHSGASLGGYITAIIVIAFGTGGIKSNIAPLIADQYQRRHMAIKTLDTQERVIIDPAITYQRIYMVFYGCINVGALSLLATPFMEKYIGFWSAYLLCFCAFSVGVVVLIVMRKSYIDHPPQGTVITDAFKAMGLMITGRNVDAAKPSWRAAHGKTTAVPWDDHFVEELKRALRACKVFAFYPIWWVCYGQFSSNFVSQAAQMEGHGMPNDLMQNFDPISIIIFLPILDRIVYPFLRKRGVELRPIARITIGFWLGALCLAYAAIVQHLIYSAGPCYKSPGNCPDGTAEDGSTLPNHVHIAVQTPAYVFVGVAEIFISVTGLEYAYTKAPLTMKSFVQSMYLLTNAFGSALNEALVPVTTDPEIQWMYTGIAVGAAIVGTAFWFTFHHYDSQEDEMNQLNAHEYSEKTGLKDGDVERAASRGSAKET